MIGEIKQLVCLTAFSVKIVIKIVQTLYLQVSPYSQLMHYCEYNDLTALCHIDNGDKTS